MMATPAVTELWVQLAGVRVAAKSWGSEDGEPLLALHGWLDNAATFDGLAPRLADRARVVAVDLPGHGLSEHRAAGELYHHVDWVLDVARIAVALGWTQFGLLGHSMGAGVASLFAGTFPERVTRLVLLEGLGPLSAQPQEAPERMAIGITRTLAVDRGSSMRVYPDLASVAKRLQQSGTGMTYAAALTLAERGTREDASGARVWRSDPRLRVPSLLRLSEEHVHTFLRRIACPVLIVRANQGYPLDESWVKRQLLCLRDVRVEHVAGGHHVHLDAPERVAPPVRKHLENTRTVA
jgi:pimeloyl-ACP methyl ester carboxylesterase